MAAARVWGRGRAGGHGGEARSRLWKRGMGSLRGRRGGGEGVGLYLRGRNFSWAFRPGFGPGLFDPGAAARCGRPTGLARRRARLRAVCSFTGRGTGPWWTRTVYLFLKSQNCKWETAELKSREFLSIFSLLRMKQLSR